MAETLVDEMKITTQIFNVISNDKHVNRGMAIKLDQWPWKRKAANQGRKGLFCLMVPQHMTEERGGVMNVEKCDM